MGKAFRLGLMAALFVFLQAGLGMLGLAQDTPPARRSLRGLSPLQVKVLTDGPGIDFEGLGISNRQLQTDAELRLRKVSIPVTGDRDTPEAILGISLYLLEDRFRPGYYSYVAKVEVLQPVVLERDETVRTMAATWSTLKFGFVGKMAVGGLRKDLDDLVDQFANAYLEQNPNK